MATDRNRLTPYVILLFLLGVSYMTSLFKTRMLKSLGYDVTAHQDSEKALALFQHKPDAFDLIITDMTMPKITGAKLAQKVFDLRPDMPVILCTGYSELINHDLAIKMGIKAYLQKPVARSKLAAAIRQALEGASP